MNFEETALSVPHDTRAGRRSRSPLNSLPEKDPSLRDLLRIFHRRTRAIVVTTAVVFFLAVFACVFMTRRYTATSIIQLQKSLLRIMPILLIAISDFISIIIFLWQKEQQI